MWLAWAGYEVGVRRHSPPCATARVMDGGAGQGGYTAEQLQSFQILIWIKAVDLCVVEYMKDTRNLNRVISRIMED